MTLNCPFLRLLTIKLSHMYYVAKVYKHSTALIVEQFESLEDAEDYASVMIRSGKGNYIVLRPLTLEETDE